MTGTPKNARWHLSEPLELDWRRKALCQWHLRLPWIGDREPNIQVKSVMVALCARCPVRVDCAGFGLTQPGGFYAGVFTPWRESDGPPDDEDVERSARDPVRAAARAALRKVCDSATHGGSENPLKDCDEHSEPKSPTQVCASQSAGEGGGLSERRAGVLRHRCPVVAQ